METYDLRSDRGEGSDHAATSRDVALLAGVSQSSVCRVFDPKWSDRISPKLRDRVLSAARELGYSPNAIARSLTANRSGIIGIIASEDFNEFYFDLVRRITNELQKLDMRVMLFNAAPYHDIQQVFRKMTEYRVDGVIATAAAISNVAKPFYQERTVPMVLVNIYSTEPFCDSVVTDNYNGSRDMAQYLYERGYRRFAYVSAENSRYFDVPDRKSGFMDYLVDKPDAHCQCFAGDYSYRSGQEIGRVLLAQETRPDCVFCSGSRMAYGIMDTARQEFGLSIPEDLAVTGYDDLDASALGSYQLTAVQQNSEQLAKATVEQLLTHINGAGPEEIQSIRVPASLVIRHSARTKKEVMD